MLHGITSLAEAVSAAEDLRCRAADPIPLGDDVLHATVSIGVTLSRSDEGVDALLARADDAMYQAKRQGKNRVVAVPPPAAIPVASP